MPKKLLVVDGQLFQTNAWDRGMAKLTYAILEALVNEPAFCKGWRMIVLFSEYLRTNDGRYKEIEESLKGSDQVFLELITPTTNSYDKAASHNREKLEEFIETLPKDQAKHFLIPALFEHSVIPVFPNNTTKHLIFHDLIPLLFPGRYLNSETAKDFYFSRFGDLFKADKIYANSLTTLNDVVTYLDIPESKLVNMGGAGFSRAMHKPLLPKQLTRQNQPFILMPSGDDLRKNNQRCVEGFAAFNHLHKNKYRLVLTSNFSDHTKNQLKRISKDLIFCGVVSEAEMRGLLQGADLVMFGPEYEGLGMPLLEAIEENKKIVCSNIGVFREISDKAFFLFDPYSPESITEALKQACPGSTLPNEQEYKAIRARYTWSRSAKALYDGLNATYAKVKYRGAKPRIAVLGPTPSGYSSIGTFIQEIYPTLSYYFDIDFFLEDLALSQYDVKPAYLSYVANTYKIEDFNASIYGDYESAWYHLGNSEYHMKTVLHALALPGYVVIHDTNLTGLFDSLLRHGYISRERYELEQNLSQNNLGAAFLGSVVNRARGVLVHSKDAQQKVLASAIHELQVNTANHPVSVPSTQLKDTKDQFKIGFAGILTSDKGILLINQLLQRPEFKHCRFKIFGFNTAGSDVLQSLQDDSRVEIETNLTDLQFQTKLASLDILINYRPRYFGETSRLTLEALRHRVCVVVRKIGWFDELPDGAVVKVEDESELLNAVEKLVAQGQQRTNEIGENGRQFVLKHYSFDAYARVMQGMFSINNLQLIDRDTKDKWLSNIMTSGISSAALNKLKEILS